MGADWNFAAAADFNADGKPDILWRNDFGPVVLWTMDGATKVADQSVSNMGLDWNLQTAGRFQR